MKKPAPRELTFQARLISISDELEYYALPIPAKVTQALGTKSAVPVLARINGSKPFLISLYPIGEGKHQMRVKAAVRKEAKIKEGDRVRVQITVRDRNKEVAIPADVARALKAAGALDDFKALPVGKRSFTLRRIAEAAKAETRAKRIQEAIKDARAKKPAG